MVIDREALAWAAGYFDGDGCFHSIAKTATHSMLIRATVASTDRELVDRFQATVGVGRVWLSRRARPPRREVWEWRVASFEKVQAVGAMLWPWLGTYRREQLIALLALARTRPGARRVAA